MSIVAASRTLSALRNFAHIAKVHLTLLNQVGRLNNQILRFESKSLLFDNDEPTTCKEAMMGPDSVKWLETIKSVIVPYTRNQVLNLKDPRERCKTLQLCLDL